MHNPSNANFRRGVCKFVAASLALAFVGTLTAQTITFDQFNDGLHNSVALPSNQIVAGTPAGVTATWHGFDLYPVAAPGGSPMGIYSSAASSVTFSVPVSILSLLVAHPPWAGACSIIGKRTGTNPTWRIRPS